MLDSRGHPRDDNSDGDDDDGDGRDGGNNNINDSKDNELIKMIMFYRYMFMFAQIHPSCGLDNNLLYFLTFRSHKTTYLENIQRLAISVHISERIPAPLTSV